MIRELTLIALLAVAAAQTQAQELPEHKQKTGVYYAAASDTIYEDGSIVTDTGEGWCPPVNYVELWTNEGRILRVERICSVWIP